MTVGIENGFLKTTEHDDLVDKFIENRGNLSEDDISKLSGEEKEQEDEPVRDDSEEPEEPSEDESGGDADEPEEDVGADGQGEGEGDEPVDLPKSEKRTRAESNQAKALRLEREKRKELEKALKAQAERSTKIEQVLESVLKPDAKEPVPDPDEDPVGYTNYKIEQLEKAHQKQQDYLRKQYEYQQQQQQQQQFINLYAEDAKTFSVGQPDFMDAYNHLIQSRIEEHMVAGYDRNIANELVKQEEAAIVAKAFDDGESPSARVYALAKKRGYAKAVNQSHQQAKSSKLEMVNQGLKSNKSLGSNTGAANKGERLNPDDIDSMSDEDFNKLYEQFKAGTLFG